MPISFTPIAMANTAQIGGNQTAARTVALDNGGYVVVWQANVGSGINTFFQRFDALGAQVGSVTSVPNPSTQSMTLQDVAVAGDGTFSIATIGAVGPAGADQRVFVTSFSQTTGVQFAPQAIVDFTPFGPNGTFGAQLVPVPSVPGSLTLLANVSDAALGADIARAVVTSAGSVTAAPVVVFQNHVGGVMLEAVEGLGGQQFIGNNAVVLETSTGGAIATGSQRDLLAVAPGTLIVAFGSTENPQVNLTMLTGSAPGFSGWTATGGTAGTSAPGLTSVGAEIFDSKLVDLGAGRILVVWVADGGNSALGAGAMVDGIYAQVYNIAVGSPEGTATLLRGFGVGSNDSVLLGIALSAEKMADGRVAVGMTFNNGLSGFDAFSTILDARVAGISVVSSTTVSETFVGTAFDDTFTNVSTGDQIIGGAGVDTVAFGTNAARSVDLQNPASLPANTFVLSGIENLTAAGGADQLRGDAAANVLSGLGGNDTLVGRDGNDSLLGGTNDDLLTGGNGNDLLDGSTGIDTLDGGADDDLMFGGTEADRLLGGTGNDQLYGGDANDRIQGDAGDDGLFGDAGDDILTGGAGNDEISGGIGADTLRAEEGADSVYGGADNDTIFAHAGVALVDGGTGTDTLRVTDSLAPNTIGVHVDLTGVFDLLGLSPALTRFAEEISGVENVTGTSGNDFITGDGLVNTLRGGAGNDTIVSGGGADVLFGNAGADVFVFTGTTGGADEVRDFAIGTDQIGLLDGAFADINSSNIASRLTINATGTVGAVATAQLIFDNAGAGFGQLFFDADGNGAGAAVLLATLTPTTGTLVALSAADFLFI